MISILLHPMRSYLPILVAAATAAHAQSPAVNQGEVKDDHLALPELKATTAEEWTRQRRPEILRLFEQHVYGKPPAGIGAPAFAVTATKTDALGGLATRKLVHISLPDCPAWPGMDVMLSTPHAVKAAPCFVGLSFGGNHAVSKEADIPLSSRWMPGFKPGMAVNHRATEESRGSESSRWPLEMILKHGYALATAYYGDLEPDHPDGWKEGVRAAVGPQGANTVWRDGDWAAIGAWAWGLGRIADFLQTDPDVDGRRLAVIGHSRLGKTALWAGARDQRFGIVISNNSGEGGAALMRRDVGETTAAITKAFPHWFTPTYAGYSNKSSACPVDQHMLIALMAPRPVYIASASEDQWADPLGEFLAGLHAGPAYALFGKRGLGVDHQPPVNTPVGDCVGYHLRAGKHDVTDYDWTQYLGFADRHWPR